MPSPPPGQPLTRSIDEHDGIRIHEIGDLTRLFPHLGRGSEFGEARCKGPPLSSLSSSSSSSSSSSAAAVPSSTSAADVVVGIVSPDARFEHTRVLTSMLPTPMLSSELAGRAMTADELNRAFASKHLVLPEMSAAVESEQLGEAGEHVINNGRLDQKAHFPPCIYSRNGMCMGQLGVIALHPSEDGRGGVDTPPPLSSPSLSSSSSSPSAPMTAATTASSPMAPPFTVRRPLQQFMFPQQHEAVHSGRQSAPRTDNPCILCLRSRATEIVMSLRAGGKLAAEVRDNIQLYRVICGPGGYNSNHCLRANVPADRNEVLFDQIVVWQPGLLYWYRNKHGRWMIDQSALRYQEPPGARPVLGETLEDF